MKNYVVSSMCLGFALASSPAWGQPGDQYASASGKTVVGDLFAACDSAVTLSAKTSFGGPALLGELRLNQEVNSCLEGDSSVTDGVFELRSEDGNLHCMGMVTVTLSASGTQHITWDIDPMYSLNCPVETTRYAIDVRLVP